MSYTCLLMVLCECANLISKANFILINRTDLLLCLHIMFQIPLQNSKGQKSYRKFWGVRSELCSVYVHILTVIDCVYILLKLKVSGKSKRTGYQICFNLLCICIFICYLICDTEIN